MGKESDIMLDYTGVKCPVCGVPFRPEDDIVVCPDCGAPYHRACYQKVGNCIFEEELHKQGKAWAPPAPPKAPDPTAEIKDQECPVCGLLNGHSALFCNRCGTSLTGQPQTYRNSPENRKTENSPPPGYQVPPIPQPGIFGGAPFPVDPMGGVSPTEFLGPNVTFGDVSKLVKQNTAYYLPVFRYIKQGRKNKFNFCAFLFSGAWLLYRKQYKSGILTTALMFALYVAYLCCTLFVSNPILLGVVNDLGLEPQVLLNPASQEFSLVANHLVQNPSLYFQIAMPMVFLLCMLVVMIIVGIRGNKMYMNHCLTTVSKIKETASHSGEAEGAILDEKGGVNVAVAICLFVCYVIIINIPLFL